VVPIPSAFHSSDISVENYSITHLCREFHRSEFPWYTVMYSDNSKRHEAGTFSAGGESDLGPIPEDKVALMLRLHPRTVHPFCCSLLFRVKKTGQVLPCPDFLFSAYWGVKSSGSAWPCRAHRAPYRATLLWYRHPEHR
jgi:hypothetical protein